MAHFGHQLIDSVRHLGRGRTIDLGSLQTRLTAGVVLASLVGIGSLATWMGWRTQQILLNNANRRSPKGRRALLQRDDALPGGPRKGH